MRNSRKRDRVANGVLGACALADVDGSGADALRHVFNALSVSSSASALAERPSLEAMLRGIVVPIAVCVVGQGSHPAALVNRLIAADMAVHVQSQPMQGPMDDWEVVSPVPDATFEGQPIHESRVMAADFAPPVGPDWQLLPPLLWTFSSVAITLRAGPAALYVVYCSERDMRQKLWSLLQAERGKVALPEDDVNRLRRLWASVYGDAAFRPQHSCVSPDDIPLPVALVRHVLGRTVQFKARGLRRALDMAYVQHCLAATTELAGNPHAIDRIVVTLPCDVLLRASVTLASCAADAQRGAISIVRASQLVVAVHAGGPIPMDLASLLMRSQALGGISSISSSSAGAGRAVVFVDAGSASTAEHARVACNWQTQMQHLLGGRALDAIALQCGGGVGELASRIGCTAVLAHALPALQRIHAQWLDASTSVSSGGDSARFFVRSARKLLDASRAVCEAGRSDLQRNFHALDERLGRDMLGSYAQATRTFPQWVRQHASSTAQCKALLHKDNAALATLCCAQLLGNADALWALGGLAGAVVPLEGLHAELLQLLASCESAALPFQHSDPEWFALATSLLRDCRTRCCDQMSTLVGRLQYCASGCGTDLMRSACQAAQRGVMAAIAANPSSSAIHDRLWDLCAQAVVEARGAYHALFEDAIKVLSASELCLSQAARLVLRIPDVGDDAPIADSISGEGFGLLDSGANLGDVPLALDLAALQQYLTPHGGAMDSELRVRSDQYDIVGGPFANQFAAIAHQVYNAVDLQSFVRTLVAAEMASHADVYAPLLQSPMKSLHQLVARLDANTAADASDDALTLLAASNSMGVSIRVVHGDNALTLRPRGVTSAATTCSLTCTNGRQWWSLRAKAGAPPNVGSVTGDAVASGELRGSRKKKPHSSGDLLASVDLMEIDDDVSGTSESRLEARLPRARSRGPLSPLQDLACYALLRDIVRLPPAVLPQLAGDVGERMMRILVEHALFTPALAPLCVHAALVRLDVSHCPLMDDDALAYVGAHCVQLSRADLSFCLRVTTLAPLAALSRLVALDVSGCVSVSDVAPLEHCTALQRLCMDGLPLVCNASLERVLRACVSLQHLSVTHCASLRADLFLRQAPPPGLASLEARNCLALATDAALWALVRGCGPALMCLETGGAGYCVTDAGLEAVAAHAPGLRKLRLSSVEATTGCVVGAFAALEHLQVEGCPKLAIANCLRGAPLSRVLLVGVAICDAELEAIARTCGASLVELQCRGSAATVTDDALRWVARLCPSLEAADVSGLLKVTDAGVASLLEACTRLASFDVSATSVTGAFLRPLVGVHNAGASMLKRLCMQSCFALTSAGVNLAFGEMEGEDVLDDDDGLDTPCLPQLSTLVLSSCVDLTNAGFALIVRRLLPPSVREVDIAHCMALTDASLRVLVRVCPALERLDVSGGPFTSSAVCSAIAELSDLRNLQALGLDSVVRHARLTTLMIGWSSCLTDAALLALVEGCPCLTSLDVRFCPQITRAAILEACAAQPLLCRLRIQGTAAASDPSLRATLQKELRVHLVE